jgi:peptide-methionine (R)-S-oxide reductase
MPEYEQNEHAQDEHASGEPDAGTYCCAACGAQLFSAEAKFDAGTGFPSFYAPLDEGRIAAVTRRSHDVHRIQVRCAACEAHLGHRFTDDAQPTGWRYCIDADALDCDAAAA